MKKMMLIGLFMIAFGISTFANVEMDLNYYFSPENVLNITDENKMDVDIKHTVPFGLEENFNFFFGSPANSVDIGLNLDTAMGLWNKKYTINTPIGDSNEKCKIGADYFLSMGPIIRLTLGNYNSISFCPGIEFDASVEKGNDTLAAFYGAAFSINLAYKYWFVNKEGFHLGLNIGTDLDFPFAGIGYFEYDYTTPTTRSEFDEVEGTDIRFFIGLAFNFGDRGYDR